MIVTCAFTGDLRKGHVSLKKNITYNILGASLPLLVTLATTPLYLRTVGNERFGIISLVWLLFGYFGLFDLGLSRATANRLTLASNRAPARQQELFLTSLMLNVALGLVAAAIVLTAEVPLLAKLGKTTPQLIGELSRAAPWVAGLIPLSTVASAVTGALEAEERFLAINMVQIFGSILMAVSPLLAVLWIEPTIEVAVAATALSRAISILPIALMAWWQYEMRRPWVFQAATIKDLFAYGGWITVTNGIGPLLVSVDQFLIAGMKGAAALPFYSIPFSLASKLLILPNAVARALFPNLSKQESTQARSSLVGHCEAMGFIMSLVCGPCILISAPALALWMGATFAESATLNLQIIVIGTWINGIAFIPFIYLQGQGRPDIPAKIHAIELAPFIGFLWLMITWQGLAGAAIAWAVRAAVDAALLLKSSGALGEISRRILPYGVFQAIALTIGSIERNGFVLIASSIVFVSLTAIYGYQRSEVIKKASHAFLRTLRSQGESEF